MPRYVALVDVRALEEFRATTKSRNVDARPSEFAPAEARPRHGFTPVHEFEAEDDDEARRYLLYIQNHGYPRDGSIGNAGQSSGSSQWRWRGTPHHIKARLDDFGLPPHYERLAQACPQFRRITAILGQQCEFYRGCRRVDGVAQINGRDLQNVRASLAHAEQEVTTQALQLAASMDAMDLAYRAFGIDDVRRRYVLTITTPSEVASQRELLPPAESPVESVKRTRQNGSK